MALDGARRGVGWLSGPREAGLEVDGEGSTAGACGVLRTGAEVATAVNFSLRFTLTAEDVGMKAGFSPELGAAALDSGVLSRVGLKPEEAKKDVVDGARGAAAGVVASEPLEGGAKEKVGVAELRVALGPSEPLE